MIKYKTIDSVNYSYDYINNNTGKLAIIFQANGQSITLSNEMVAGSHKLPGWEERKEEVHSRYTFLKIFLEAGFDVLVLPDTYSEFVGWYTIDKGKDISDGMVQFIDNLVIELGYGRKNSILFGQSKGGFATMYYGSRLDNVGSVLCSFPIVDPCTRLSSIKTRANKVQRQMMRGDHDDQYLDDFLTKKMESIYIDSNKKYYVYLGISDEDTTKMLQLIKGKPIHRLLINKRITTHAKYAPLCRPGLESLLKEISDEM